MLIPGPQIPVSPFENTDRYSGQWIPTSLSLSFKNRTDSVVRGSLRPSKKSDTAVRRSLDSLKIQTVLAVRRLKHLSFKNRTDSWIPASPFKIWTHSAVRRSLHPPLKFQTDLAVRGFHHLHLKNRNDSAVRGSLTPF